MAAKRTRPSLQTIASGVPNLDPVLGGGIPAYSTNVIAGPPGVGKTTLAHQIIFHNATPQAPALYCVALGEPTVKLIRYQQQFAFFDDRKVEQSIFYVDLGTPLREGGLARTLEFIMQQVEQHSPALLCIDSVKALKEAGAEGDVGNRAFVHDLANALAFWQTTSFLIGEYTEQDIGTVPEMSVADGIIWLSQEIHQNVAMNKMRVVKMRGQASQRGKHSYRIDKQGITVFPRVMPPAVDLRASMAQDRVATGVEGLDRMLRGGIPRGEVALVAGSTGTGKTLLSLHFLAAGLTAGEPAVMATFEESPVEHERKAAGFGWDLADWQRRGLLEMIYLRPIDLSADQVLYELQQSVTRLGAKRVVINSVSGFELGLEPADRQEFRESLYRMVASLTVQGVTTLLTTEIPDIYGTLRIWPEGVSLLADNAIIMRYVEIESQLRRAVSVVKMRTSDHDKDLRQFTILPGRGIVVEQPFEAYTGILSGSPTPRAAFEPQPYTAGLSVEERQVVQALSGLRQATPAEVATRVGREEGQVRAALDKLADTGYVLRGGSRERPVYRAALGLPAQAPRR